ncbi:DJ-1/PfpI family protein [Dactylonectria macrodidyma]|uniref:DJ-1/PfpI family protein n=1 Tax=Dactylonectria macrodidyma TaxID=307937 RepID=A0A9P9J676_9HYPO|nr:DJ-1/PfpI family protein [Dactylonectria macrodidyma]
MLPKTAAVLTPSTSTSPRKAPELPKNYGIVVFRAFEMLDVFGPLNALGMLAKTRQLNLYIISDTLDLVSTQPMTASMNSQNSSFFPQIQPTHTFDTIPDDIDVLIIPGGLGVRSPHLSPTVDYVAKTYPKLKYLITICTGAVIAAKAGVLDGRRATTNKASWKSTIANGPNVNWVNHARWVVDGNIWTSSGISAGIDTTLAFIEDVYGSENANHIANMMEYERHSDPSWDPFSEIFGTTK